MKKIIVMLLVSAGALVGMASAAAGLAAVQTNVVRVVGDEGVGGGSGRYWGCAGNDQVNQAVCVEEPVPTSSVGVVQIRG